jgi:hypothetical protein
MLDRTPAPKQAKARAVEALPTQVRQGACSLAAALDRCIGDELRHVSDPRVMLRNVIGAPA